LTADRAADRERSLVVELVGPAGAGKTTLLHALRQRDPRIRGGLRVGRLRQARELVKVGAMLFPTLVHRDRSNRWFSREELRSIAYLGGWHELLVSRDLGAPALTVLDLGPVFRLATLREFGPTIGTGSAFEIWWSRTLERWRTTLDRVVWLDAPDPMLLARIRGRESRHVVKERPEAEAREFLRRYRAALQGVLGKLSVAGGPETLRFDSSRHSPGEIAAEVLAAAGSGLSRGLDRAPETTVRERCV
jgi:shikimate kinase